MKSALAVLVVVLLPVPASAAAGDLDSSFSGDGKKTTDILGLYNPGYGLSIAPDGKIVVAGTANTGPGNDMGLARYRPGGNLDDTFSGDGIRTLDLGAGNEGAEDVAVQQDGRIVAVGYTEGAGGTDFAIARFRLGGALDPGFAGDGIKTTDFAGGLQEAYGVVLQENGKIVAAGYTDDAEGTEADFLVTRYEVDGSLDQSFSGDGKKATDFGPGDDVAYDVAVQPDGAIVVVGSSSNGATLDFAIARYEPDGSLDDSFSGDGKKTIDFGSSDGLEGVAVQPNGKIVVTGWSSNGSDRDVAVARLRPGGKPDDAFSDEGFARHDFTFGDDEGHDVALQEDGKIVVAGQARLATTRFAVLRFQADGDPDPSFGGAGWVTTPFGPGASSANGVAIQADGRIVAGGQRTEASADFAVARYLAV
jgi:uncharacterized delta-60 repeat protein